MLCRWCKKVLTAYFTSLPDHKHTTQFMAHHISLESLADSVARKCQICCIIALELNFAPPGIALSRGFRLFFQQIRASLDKSRDIITFQHTKLMPELKQVEAEYLRRRTDVLTEFRGQLDGRLPRLSTIEFVVVDKNERHAPFAKLENRSLGFFVQPCENMEFLRRQGSGKVSQSTGSSDCLRQVSDWYNYCVQNHAACSKNISETTFCPTRLLDLSFEEDKVLLVELNSSAVDVPYMTLSHCWGKVPLLQHTASTASLLRSGLPIKNLPPTFRDAVNVARGLMCRYLWIDSLCIVQDDPKDWEVQAVLMDEVYSHSLCNIAATGSSNSLGGLFFKRDAASVLPCIFDLKSGTNHSQQPYLIIQRDIRRAALEKEPLQKRGWVLQERRLPSRLIDFSSKELMWQCRQLQASETFPAGIPSWPYAGQEHSVYKILNRVFTPEDDWISNASIYFYWADIVRDYTTRVLNHSQDKLIAISGIAKQLRKATRSEYVAGLWREALPQQLLWYVPNTDSGDTQRVQKYRAPSWSWAAIDGAVIWGASLKTKDVVLAEVLAVEITPRSVDNPFGLLEDGCLRVRAHLQPVIFEWVEETHSNQIMHHQSGYELPFLLDYLDVPEKRNLGDRRFFCMPVQHKSIGGRHKQDLAGLLLEQIDGTGDRYARVGYYEEDPAMDVYYSLGEWNSKKREIILI